MDETENSKELLNSDQTVYEVIRVTGGTALFLEDHFIRLQKSLAILGLSSAMEFQEFKHQISELIRLDQKLDGNIRFVYSVAGGESQWSLYYIPHTYPTATDYHDGVNTGLLYAEREKPNAKVVQDTLRELADRMMADQKLYEVLLVDRHGMITEGSRSNVFFVKNEVFYTAPASEVLVGITRQKVIECLIMLGYSVIEEAVAVTEIGEFDAAFLTGTSPKVLPIKMIGNQEFNTRQHTVEKLMECYNNLINKYIQSIDKQPES